jgi:4-amino-4-deoxy-L-arabinose transferase-like glycosyltransferase
VTHNIVTRTPRRVVAQAASRLRLPSTDPLVWLLALTTFVGHMLVAGNYGYFRDELYYLMDGRHLAFGYVDQPPLIGWLAALTDLLFHDSLVAIHIIPALAGAALVVVAALLCRELGGGRAAQVLTALATMCSTVFLATTSIFSMDILDALCWTLAAYVLARTLRRGEPRGWLWFGLVAGVGLLNKLTILFFGFAVVVGLLLTPERRVLRTRWPWLGGAIAFALVLPYVLWNAANGWPTLTFWTHYGGLGAGGPVSFLANQLFLINPFNLPLVIAGLWYYFRLPEGRSFRVLGWAYVVLYLLFTLIQAKPYFLGPAYPLMYAGGAVTLAGAWRRRRVLLLSYASAILLSRLLLAPLAMPVLPPATFVRTYGALTGVGNGGAGQSTAGTFPQYLGDRFGWNALTASVARVYAALPPAEQRQACIFTANYGEASALALLGAPYHLPPVISGHNNYFLWGPGTCTGQVIIAVNIPQATLAQGFHQVTLAGTSTCAYCMAYEDGIPIDVCTQPVAPLSVLWLSTRHFN